MSNVIKDVAYRTNGELYIGVLGSVRCGKSMFIRKFMQTKVLPYVLEEEKNKIIDELPQSAEGKSIMTVEPKFVPSNPATIVLEDNLTLSIRMVDCVGYVLSNAKGYKNEDGSPRLVKTPWFTDDIPFDEAAHLGTRKVMENHSHIGLLLTSDGSFGEFKRKDYEEVEEQLVDEMKELHKPFVIVLNTIEPNSNQTLELAKKLEDKYQVSVIPVDVSTLSDADIDKILKEALNEFDISKLEINAPTWLSNLDEHNPHKIMFDNIINETTGTYRKFKEVSEIQNKLMECPLFTQVDIVKLDSGTGEVEMVLDCPDELYDDILEEIVGDAMNDKGAFIQLLQECMIAKEEYKKYQSALEAVKSTGYGIATPTVEDMTLDTPAVIKQGSRYGIKLRALAPSIHMIKVDVESSFEPIIGSEEQSNMLVDKLMKDYEVDPNTMWQSEIFGRKLSEVVNDGVRAKLYMVPENIQFKLRECMEKIVNKGKGSFIAIVL